MCFFAFLHTLNLVLVDAAKASSDFFIPSKMYRLFSAAPQRWTIFKKHVEISLKAETIAKQD